MFVRAFVFAAVTVLGGAAAFAEGGEGNNLAAVEVPAGTGVYYTNAQPAQPQGAVPARVAEVAQAPVARR